MEDNSEKSEELLEDDDNELDIDSNQVFGIGNTDVESESLFGIEPDDMENDSELVLDIETTDHEPEPDQILEFQPTNLDIETANHDLNSLPPIVGMEFESYEDAYKYYNCYAKELGFGIRVKSSWTKRNSKEKRGAVLCCNCEGFKTLKEASTRRKETRTGCLAMIRLRLIESNRWRVDEVKLEHNHLFDPERAQNSKSHKRAESVKRKLNPIADVEVRTIKLYRTPTMDTVSHERSLEKEFDNNYGNGKRLDLKKGDTKIIHDYFSRVQLTNPNFFYIMDFTDDGYLKNVFWIDSRARASYNYFGDVIALDTTSLKNNYNVPLVVFVGSNHHGQTIPLGFGLLTDESQQTYTWLLRAWLTCMAGRPPQTIITDQSPTLQTVIPEIFPRAHHRLFLPLVIESILENFQNLEFFQSVLNNVIHNSIKVDEFELAWEDMIDRFSVRHNEMLRKLFEDRERWAPVYLKDTFFAGMLTFQPVESTESTVPFFHGYVRRETTLKEFFSMHDLVIQNKIQKESFDDRESTQSSPKLKTISRYESHLAKIYTKEIFSRFQFEVEMMSNCFNVSQVNTSGSIVTYMVTEQESGAEGNTVRNMEVMYDKIGVEVRCICSCFNFRGYLCRHALVVLNHNGVEEVPGQYVLARWRKDFKRVYVADLGSDCVDMGNPVQWFVGLHKRALQVVEEGMTSHERYSVAWQAFKESLNKVRLVGDKLGQSGQS